MKKRILSFALVLLFCFGMIGTAGLTGEHAHVHATGGAVTTLGIISYTDTEIKIHAVADGYKVEITDGAGYNESTAADSANVDKGANVTTFKELTPNTDYTLKLYNGDTLSETITQKTKNPAPAAPAAPTVKSYGSTNITLNTSAENEYSLDNCATWQKGNASMTTFFYEDSANAKKIEAGKTYTIYARVAGTSTAMPSANSGALTVTTVPVPTSIEFSGITSNTFTISEVSGIEYSINGNDFTTNNTFSSIVPGKEYTVYARYAAVAADNRAAGDVYTQKVIIPAVSVNTSVKDDLIHLTLEFKPSTFALANVKYKVDVTYTFGGTHTSTLEDQTGGISIPVNGTFSQVINTNLPASTTGAKYTATVTANVCGADRTILSVTDAALEGTHTHNYNYKPADCTSPAECSCGATSGSALGHKWKAATCQAPKTCERCYAKEGAIDANAHVDANKDGKCDLCSATVCQHTFPANAKCTQAQTCTKCSYVKPAGDHIFDAATCTTAMICKLCGEKDGTALGHKLDSSNKCTQCSQTLITHNYNYHSKCNYCGKCINTQCVAYIGCDGTSGGCNGSTSGKVAHTAGHLLCSKCGKCLTSDCEQYDGCTAVKCSQSSYGGDVEHNSLHDTLFGKCPKCGSCLASECKNYRGCNGVICKNVGGTSTHLSTHSTCTVCQSCLVSSCQLYKGCTSTNCNNRPGQDECTHAWEAVKYEVYPCSDEAKQWGGYGSGTFKCKKCLKEEERIIAATGHLYGAREKLSNGTWIQKCTYGCGHFRICEDQTCGHDFNTYFKLQKTSTTDCTVGGTWKYVCSYPSCGYTVDKTVTAAAHKFDAGKMTTPVTDTTAGVKTFTCTVCGKTKTETIPATNPCAAGHSYGQWTVTKNADCTTAGSKTRTCSVCKNVDTDAIPATGHTFSDYVVGKNSTCKDKGYKICSCTKCATEKREDLPLADHKMVLSSSTEATCIADGLTVYECSVCKNREETKTLATGKHSFIDDGENAKKCVACSFRYELVNDGNKKLMKLSDGEVSLTVMGSNADTYFYGVSEKTESDFQWFASWMEFLKNKGEVSSDASLVKAYDIEMTNAGESVALDEQMSATIVLPEENKKTSVKLYTVKGNTPVEITEFKRSGSKITISGEALDDSTGEFFVIAAKTAKKSNPAVAIVIGIVAVVAVAGAGGFFLYKKGFFSSVD